MSNLNVGGGPFGNGLNAGQYPSVVPGTNNQIGPLGNAPNDVFVSAASKIVDLGGSQQFVYSVYPTDQIVYDPTQQQVYVARSGTNGTQYIPLQNSVDNTSFDFPDLGTNTNIPSVVDSQGRTQQIQAGDQLVYDPNKQQLFIQRKGTDGQTQLIPVSNGQGDLTTQDAQNNQTPSVDVQAALNDITKNGKTFEALGIPGGLTTGPVDVSGVFPRFGDQTGVSIAASIYTEAGIYNQLQKTITIINYLNTAPNGVQPNANFAYISGRPPYGQDTKEGQAMQAKVFAAIRTTIIAQLTRIADQLKSAYQGIRQQRTAAEGYKKTQDGDVQKWVSDATGGGGAGAAPAGG
jgi:hypothetical protein